MYSWDAGKESITFQCPKSSINVEYFLFVSITCHSSATPNYDTGVKTSYSELTRSVLESVKGQVSLGQVYKYGLVVT